jgi:regulator of RNase E activity RraA
MQSTTTSAVANGQLHPAVSVAEPGLDFTRPDPELVERVRRLPAANIGDAMDRLGVMDSRIKPLWPGATVAGPAFTVWTRAGDNAAIHVAMRLARPGDVIVVNGQGDETRALMGELMGGRAKVAGLAGFVLDGCARDASDLAELDVPVFARACTPAGPYKNGPGRVGVTIAVGGVAVSPGDVVVGDADGVVVIPAAELPTVVEAAEAVFADEAARRSAIGTFQR